MKNNKDSKIFISIIVLLFSFFMAGKALAKDVPYTLEDRDRLIRIETSLKEFKEAVDMRFEQVDKRFEQIDKRFEQIDKRFEQIDKRFEQVDKRLEFMQNLMIGMLAVFGGLCGVFGGLLLWDRRTFKDMARNEAIKAVEEGRLKVIIETLREMAKSDSRMADALKKFHLL